MRRSTSKYRHISIRTKLLIYILLTTIIIFVATLSYIITNTNNNAIKDAEKFVNATAQQYANKVKAELDNDIATCRSLVHAFSGFKDIEKEQWVVIYNQIMKDLLIENPQFYSVWTSWELNAIDPTFNEENGRERYTYYREGSELLYQEETLEVGESNLGGIYYDIKNNPREVLTEPYLYSYTDQLENQILESSIAIPLMDNGVFIGLTGSDVELDRFHEIIENIVPFEGSYASMISAKGVIISHPDSTLENTSIYDSDLSKFANFDIEGMINSGEAFSFTEITDRSNSLFVSFAPFNPGVSSETWYVIIIVPSDVILEKADKTFAISVIVGFFGIIILAFLIWFIAKTITTPLIKTTKILNQLSTGDIKNLEKLEINTRDELSEMANALKKLSNSLKGNAEFAINIGKGKLDEKYHALSNRDLLGNALLQMRENLLELRTSNEKNQWMQTSIVRISELLQGDKTIKNLGNQILTSLATILDIQIASIFLNNNQEELVLVSSYSYDFRKSKTNKFKFGEGLIGQAAAGQKMMIYNDIPEDYISVKSSLGEAIPNIIIVIPLIYNKQVIAIIEIGSTKEITQTKLDFISQISENIAIAFNSIVTRSEMKILLSQTQSQAEELRVQQEELVHSNSELEDQTNALKVSEEELQQQQEELKVTNEELEEKTRFLEQQKLDISNKNLELENAGEELKQKAKEIEVASKYKSEFLANMSHELRTPLNSLLILSGSLSQNKEKNLNAEQVESAEIIYKSGNDLLSMINDILDLSKIESGKMAVNIEKVKIESISENIRDYFKHGTSQKNIEFKIIIDKDVPSQISTDQQKTEQIIKNFMSNALKFTSKGSITLQFHNSPDNDNDQHNAICISVIDTGIGIPENKQLEIFEAFQQADGSISRKFGGTGLGLSISRELAKLLGGKIQLKSKHGEGSTFTLYLPVNGQVIKADDKEVPSTIKEVTKTTEIKADLSDSEPKQPMFGSNRQDFIEDDFDNLKDGDEIILVIEDDPTFAKILYKQCHERGFKCIASPTGEFGIEIAGKVIPNAIILDIKLPGIDGWRVLDLLKENPATRHIPVHVMSGEEETIAATSKGAIGYLTKPIKKGVLQKAFSKIESFISKKTGNLLLVEDDDNLRKSIKILLRDKTVKITDAASGDKALKLLAKNDYDCMILDLGLSDMTGFELIEKLNQIKVNRPPIIVYTGRDLTKDENATLEKYAESIIIKGVKSEERLLDETALFMHRVIADMPKQQQNVIKNMHTKEAVFKDKKVLLVDDDMRNIFALTKVLSEHNMNISRAENGKVALEIIKQNPRFDVILMDIMMPEMDGYEAMREIRKIPKQRNTPIIALTAKAMKEDRQKCIEAGANDYMAKPIVIEKLLSLLRVWLYK